MWRKSIKFLSTDFSLLALKCFSLVYRSLKYVFFLSPQKLLNDPMSVDMGRTPKRTDHPMSSDEWKRSSKSEITVSLQFSPLKSLRVSLSLKPVQHNKWVLRFLCRLRTLHRWYGVRLFWKVSRLTRGLVWLLGFLVTPDLGTSSLSWDIESDCSPMNVDDLHIFWPKKGTWCPIPKENFKCLREVPNGLILLSKNRL